MIPALREPNGVSTPGLRISGQLVACCIPYVGKRGTKTAEYFGTGGSSPGLSTSDYQGNIASAGRVIVKPTV